MFKIEKETSIRWPVTVNVPRDGGRITKATFGVRFELIPADEFATIYRDGGNDEDLLRRAVTGWDSDVADAEGTPLAYSTDALDQLIGITDVRAGMVAAYIECSSGKAAARKNL